ncbi:MAG: tetratricopeptide repeat protein [Acidobacteria bacterium]|nr:tetratricopeptide repeat protein [Acidobacteriota bacterium]
MSRHRRRGARQRTSDRRGDSAGGTLNLSWGGAMFLPLVPTLLLVAGAWATPARTHPVLFRSFLAAGGAMLLWQLVVFVAGRRRTFTLHVAFRAQHYLQALAQIAILAYWGWYWRDVYGFAYLIGAQLLFAYAFEALLAWSRRDDHTIGIGPLPIVFSINLFLWFRPEWFHLQFLLVALGYCAKEFIRWSKDGRRAHIFNPSSFPLGVVSLILLATGTTDLTYGVEIATTQLFPPHIYLVVFLAALPVQLRFGVATMTLAAVTTTYGLSLAYLGVTGSHFFVEAAIPIAVFLGMHLLFTDPSTSPRTEMGRLTFGVLYGASVFVLFAVLGAVGAPTFYDKLLAVPLLNLLIQVIDRLTGSAVLRRFDPARLGPRLTPRRRNLAYVAVWAAVFVVLQTLTGAPVTLARADTLLAHGRIPEAIAGYRELIATAPDHAAGHNKLGYALLQIGRTGEAVTLLRRGVRLQPEDAEAHNNLGLALMQAGSPREALASIGQALTLRPDYAGAHYNMAHALTATGRQAEAVVAFREALRARPDWPTALGALAWLHATSGDPDVRSPEAAVELAMQAAELSQRQDVAVLDALAAAYAAADRFDEATRTAEAAEALAATSAPHLVEGIAARLGLYRAGRPVIAGAP